ncbi:hypothetical protein C7M84_019114 [Penaeus vannamei]|uniref:Uncharacterized protein n=1 Tax=Penaeus vannamei TaxID=6689 RepID=A0A3R7LU49_PENVA|nr:hypothetical protein C7M84_019114 [Penaeus vannamei]
MSSSYSSSSLYIQFVSTLFYLLCSPLLSVSPALSISSDHLYLASSSSSLVLFLLPRASDPRSLRLAVCSSAVSCLCCSRVSRSSLPTSPDLCYFATRLSVCTVCSSPFILCRDHRSLLSPHDTALLRLCLLSRCLFVLLLLLSFLSRSSLSLLSLWSACLPPLLSSVCLSLSRLCVALLLSLSALSVSVCSLLIYTVFWLSSDILSVLCHRVSRCLSSALPLPVPLVLKPLSCLHRVLSASLLYSVCLLVVLCFLLTSSGALRLLSHVSTVLASSLLVHLLGRLSLILFSLLVCSLFVLFDLTLSFSVSCYLSWSSCLLPVSFCCCSIPVFCLLLLSLSASLCLCLRLSASVLPSPLSLSASPLSLPALSVSVNRFKSSYIPNMSF